MDLTPSGTYGLGSVDANADLQAYGQNFERTSGVLGAFTCDSMKVLPEAMETAAGSTVFKPALNTLLQTRNHKNATGTTSSIDPLTGNRVDAAFRKTPKKIVLIQAPPVISHDEDEDQTSGRGDFTFFDARLSRGDKPFGSLTGTIETNDLVTGSKNLEVRLRTLIFEPPKGQLVAQGASSYPTGPDFVPLNVNDPVVIAVTGGTGAYMGATGEVRTTRRGDGTYRQAITLLQSQRSGRRALNNKG